MQGLENEAELILQPFRHFTDVTTHSPTLPSFYLRHSSLSNPSVASPTSQFILQPFFRFSYVTSSSLNSPGEPPMNDLWYRHALKPILLLLNSTSVITFVKKCARASCIVPYVPLHISSTDVTSSAKTDVLRILVWSQPTLVRGIVRSNSASFMYFCVRLYVCVSSNANPLHYYVLRIARYADRWH